MASAEWGKCYPKQDRGVANRIIAYAKKYQNKKSTKQRTVPMFEGDPFDGGDPKYEQPL